MWVAYPMVSRIANPKLWIFTIVSAKKYLDTFCFLITGSPPLIWFFETLMKPCCKKTDLVLNLQNETAGMSKVNFLKFFYYSDQSNKDDIKLFYHKKLWYEIISYIVDANFINLIPILEGIEENEKLFEKKFLAWM